MPQTSRNIDKIIEEQILRWQQASRAAEKELKKPPPLEPVIAVSRLPGCNTADISGKLAKKMNFDVFNGQLMALVAEDAKLSISVVETLDEKCVSTVEDWIKSFIVQRYFCSEEYFHRLLRVVGTIGKHGRAIIVGRGAGFMLPPAECLRVLLVAPLEIRIGNVVKKMKVPYEQARSRVIQRESDRKAYIRKYFHAEMTDPIHYDLVVNTEELDVDTVVEILHSAWKAKKAIVEAKGICCSPGAV